MSNGDCVRAHQNFLDQQSDNFSGGLKPKAPRLPLKGCRKSGGGGAHAKRGRGIWRARKKGLELGGPVFPFLRSPGLRGRKARGGQSFRERGSQPAGFGFEIALFALEIFCGGRNGSAFLASCKRRWISFCIN